MPEKKNKQDEVDSMMELTTNTTKTHDPAVPLAFLQQLGVTITPELEKYNEDCDESFTIHELERFSQRNQNTSAKDNLDGKMRTLQSMKGQSIKYKLLETFLASYYFNEKHKTQPMPDPVKSALFVQESINNNNHAFPGSRDRGHTAAFFNTKTNAMGYGNGQPTRGQTMLASSLSGRTVMPNPTTTTTRSINIIQPPPQQAYRAYRNGYGSLLQPTIATTTAAAANNTDSAQCDHCGQGLRPGQGKVGRLHGPQNPPTILCGQCASTNEKFQPDTVGMNASRRSRAGAGEQLLASTQPGGSSSNNNRRQRGLHTLNQRPSGNNNKTPLALINTTTGPSGEQQQQQRRQRKKPQGTDANPIDLVSDDDDNNKNNNGRKQDQEEEAEDDFFSTQSISGRQRSLRQTTLNTRRAANMKTEIKLQGLKCLYPPQGGPGSVELSALDVARLDDSEFLNDSVIDYYIQWLQSDIPKDVAARCYFFNTFFYKKLTEKNTVALPEESEQYRIEKNLRNMDLWALMNHEKVKKWTKDADIFAKDYLFIPVHTDLHWSLIIVCNPGLWDPSPSSVLDGADDDDDAVDPRVKPRAGPVLIHLDSMTGGHNSRSACDLVRRYLWFEWVSKMRAMKVQQQLEANGGPPRTSTSSTVSAYQRWEMAHPDGEERVFDDKTFPYRRANAPRQDNYCDCGLFVLCNTEFFVRRLPESINMAAISALREKYDKDNLDLLENSNNNNKRRGDSNNTEYGTFPGMLTPYWYTPQNASNLRWRIRHDILQLLGEQNQMYDRERNTFAPVETVPAKMRELRKNLEEDFDNVTALMLQNPYYSPKDGEFVQEQIENKKTRNRLLLERMQAQEDRKRLDREEKRRKTEAAARAAEARAAMQPDEDFTIDLADNTRMKPDDNFAIHLDDDNAAADDDDLERNQQKARKVVKMAGQKKGRKVTNIIHGNTSDDDDDSDNDDSLAAQFQMTRGGVDQQQPQEEDEEEAQGAAGNTRGRRKRVKEEEDVIMIPSDDDDDDDDNKNKVNTRGGRSSQADGHPKTRSLADLQNDGPADVGSMKTFSRMKNTIQHNNVNSQASDEDTGDGGWRTRRNNSNKNPMSNLRNCISDALQTAMGDDRRMKRGRGDGFPTSSLEEEKI